MKSVSLALCVAVAAAAPAADLVANLPGWGAPLTTMYRYACCVSLVRCDCFCNTSLYLGVAICCSGYLDITTATGSKSLHYVFYESQANPATSPVQVRA